MEFTCRNCGTHKWPIEEPNYGLEDESEFSGKAIVTGWRMECLGHNEGRNCYLVSPFYCTEEDARKYGTAYLEGKYVA